MYKHLAKISKPRQLDMACNLATVREHRTVGEIMARPIEATPELNEHDSAKLLESLADVCSREEAARRIAVATQRLAAVMMPAPSSVNELGC
jgi:hypothetical protein